MAPDPTLKRIAVMGTGGVGGYFGARLKAAGHDVSFIARGAHLDALKASGLTVASPLGDLALAPVTASDDPAEIGPVDAIVFAVKLGDTESAAERCRPLLTPETSLFTFQNGVESAARIGAVIGAEHVVTGVAYIAATIAAPGVIRHTGQMAKLVFGEADGQASARCEAFAAACREAGIDHELSGDVTLALWQKFIRLAPLAGVTALTRHPVGPIRENARTRALLGEAVAEAIAVARAEGAAISVEETDAVLAWFDGLPAEMTSSMAGDLERGKPLELDGLNGALVRLAERHGLDVPAHRFITQALELQKEGAA